MNFMFVLLTALVISVSIIPVMIRFASNLGMVDMPDPRKVHAFPIPRVGGIGIVVGSLVSILLWVPLDNMMLAYLFGSLVLLVFGALDDSHELGHYVKFIGQFIAVGAVVYWGDVWVSSMPFMDHPVSEFIGKPFTVIAIVGMVNAINHSDGLDGLAGGESLLSLACLAYLAYLAGGVAVVMVAAAVIGGVFGFLRFNTHPAKVFMGDSGSQFLGFSLGVLAVVLTQKVNTGLSMALPVLILGLPIIDIIAVFAQRIYHGMNWFRATRNHIHHRLLDLGYDHYQAVVIIYAIHAFFVVSALCLQYAFDWVVLALYSGVCLAVFAVLVVAKNKGWKANKDGAESGITRIMTALKMNRIFSKWPLLFVKIAIPLYLLLGSLWVEQVSRDFGLAAIVIAALLLFGLVFRKMQSAVYLVRMAIFGTAAFLVYLIHQYTGATRIFSDAMMAYFVVLAIAIAIAVRYAPDLQFKTTPTDYLMVFMVIAASLFSQQSFYENDLGVVVVKVLIMFYGCELIINRGSRLSNGLLDFSVMVSAGILGVKALMLS